MNQAEYLCHSSGPWKKHKYFQKIGEGANAVYKYSKKAITGSDYKEEADRQKREADFYSEKARELQSEIDKYGPNANRSGTLTSGIRDARAKDAAYAGRKAAEAQSNYYNKSLFGKAEKNAKQTVTKVSQISKSAKSTVAKGEKILKDFFTPKVTETVTNVSTGKKRTPSHSGTTINIKTGKVTRR